MSCANTILSHSIIGHLLATMPPREQQKCCRFNLEWTEKYFVHEINNKPVCLICNSTLAHNKVGNVSRHYQTNHVDYNGRFPAGTQRRKEQLQRLQTHVLDQRRMFQPSNALQQRTTLASYEVAQAIGKAMAPYQHSELVKECMERSMKALFPDKKDIYDTIKKVPLSRQTCGSSLTSKFWFWLFTKTCWPPLP